jgi:hypothetical protein
VSWYLHGFQSQWLSRRLLAAPEALAETSSAHRVPGTSASTSAGACPVPQPARSPATGPPRSTRPYSMRPRLPSARPGSSTPTLACPAMGPTPRSRRPAGRPSLTSWTSSAGRVTVPAAISTRPTATARLAAQLLGRQLRAAAPDQAHLRLRQPVPRPPRRRQRDHQANALS